ncbi:Bax inhibitor-1/YccA family protein [Dinghuibacter silviterrae]|nr:Bax inhibitor-1/YccA family protein [Dinghuibacter silviterrae]
MENNINLSKDNYRTEKVTVLSEFERGAVAKSFMSNVFLWMFGALAITGVTAYIFASNADTLLSFMFAPNAVGRLVPTGLGYLVIFAPLGFVLLMSFGYQRLSASVMALLFVLYALINGISFSVILLGYTASSVATCFFSSAAMFGVMAVMGYTTKKDLTGFGSIMIMGLIGIIVASVINMFLHSSQMEYVISFIGVLVFTGLTAYDVQKLKNIGAGVNVEDPTIRKVAIMGALNLYLDFINLFLMMLRLFGRRR